MKSKIAITLDSSLLRRIDQLSEKQNRSAYIEKILKQSIDAKKLNTAVILAGGAGVRLRPFTYEIPKPMVPVKGKPVIRWQVEMLKKHGIDNIIISLGYQKNTDQIIKEFGKDVNYVFERSPLGTGGALSMIKDHVDGHFLVMNGDTLHAPVPNLTGMYDFHLEKGTMATLLVMMKEDVRRYGSVSLEEDGKIVKFAEKVKEKKPGLISSGIYILSPEIFKFIKRKCSIENEIFPKLMSKDMLTGYFFNGKTYDVGTLKGYEHAIKEWSA
ncbi:MAG: NTP transferase domain-containing protein [Nanoarchaeota archaeon]|nr:NTP transferase domain-containing protein [Nanoarchaeota archaeon]